MNEMVKYDPSIDGEFLSPDRTKGVLQPMGDCELGKRVWEPYRKGGECEPGGVSLGTNDHTEGFCRVSGYLRNAAYNARRLCACWNAFMGVPLAEIEQIARERSGWIPPSGDEMWRHPDAAPTRTVRDPAKRIGRSCS